MSAHIRDRAAFESVRYANCWEDADILCAALQPAAGKRILSIASAGDNALALAAEGAEVVAVDLSRAQIACLELRRAAFLALDHPGVLAFLGVRTGDDRTGTYARLRPQLDDATRAYWDARPAAIAAGIVHDGKFERYFGLFRRYALPIAHSRRRVAALLEERDREGRERFYHEVWDTWRWRLLFTVFFSRRLMGLLGRDPEFFRYVQGSVGERMLARARKGLTFIPTHDNPFLNYIVKGSFGAALPRYLEPGRFDAVRAGAQRIRTVVGTIEDAAAEAGPFDGFNLSDIFEYLSPDVCASIYTRILGAARPGARFAYWNMLAPRRRPDSVAARIVSLDESADALHDQDRAIFYRAFVVEEARA